MDAPIPRPAPKPTPPPSAYRAKIIARYARKQPNGRPMFCGPIGPRKERKVIFDTLEAAQAAETKLRAIGRDPQRAYPCERSRHGHYHLTRRGAEETS